MSLALNRDELSSVFRTSHGNPEINETSSYIDLAPLYGHDHKSGEVVRKHDGYGLLKPDTFAEDRLLLLPPAVCALLVLFNRNHNVRSRMSGIHLSHSTCRYVDLVYRS